MKTNLLRLLLLSALGLFTAISAGAQPAKSRTTITGQLVCSDCWFEADRKTDPYGTAADISCAVDCAEKGIPSAVAVKEGDDYHLYLIEQSQFKSNRSEWLDRIGRQVEVSGQVYTKKKKEYISVESYKFLPASDDSKQPQSQAIGSQVELALKDIAGIDQRMSSFRGRVVVLNFWATWCVPCRKEMPDLAAIQSEYAAFGVQVIGATADQVTERAKVLQFVREAKINFPVWFGATTADMGRFGVGPGLPATVIIDRDGKIAAVHQSVIHQAQLKKQIDRLLGVDRVALAREAPTKTAPADVSLVPS